MKTTQSKTKGTNYSRAKKKNPSTQQSEQGEQNMDTSALHELFIEELKDIYWAEKHLVKNLPKLIKAATSDELKEAIESHLAETEEHVTRLDQVFESIDEKASAKKCD